MILASLKSKNVKNRNGELVVVSKDHSKALLVEPNISLVQALESWKEYKPKLTQLYEGIDSNPKAFPLKVEDCIAPITNGPGFYDGSAFLSHVVRARRARGDQMPESAKKTPLMYQGVSDNQIKWNAPLHILKAEYGGDFEGEFAAIVDDIPAETAADEIEKHIALFCMFNDVTYREIVKTELETKFGFLQSKPNSSYAPFVVTPDELGSSWKNGRIHLELEVQMNGKIFGHPKGTEMHFSFQELIAHACRTRPLSAGSIIGTGTISNEDASVGFACLTEKRFQEILDSGKPTTPWLKAGDEIEMNVKLNGQSVFGKIVQKVVV